METGRMSEGSPFSGGMVSSSAKVLGFLDESRLVYIADRAPRCHLYRPRVDRIFRILFKALLPHFGLISRPACDRAESAVRGVGKSGFEHPKWPTRMRSRRT